MKQFTKMMLLASLLISFAITIHAQTEEENAIVLSWFPKPAPGMERHVIFLEEKTDESLYEIEITPEKFMLTDCNSRSFLGEWEKIKLRGYRSHYYIYVPKTGFSTMRGCLEPKKYSFVSGPPIKVPYNSLFPVVVYTPEGFEIKHKILEVED